MAGGSAFRRKGVCDPEPLDCVVGTHEKAMVVDVPFFWGDRIFGPVDSIRAGTYLLYKGW